VFPFFRRSSEKKRVVKENSNRSYYSVACNIKSVFLKAALVSQSNKVKPYVPEKVRFIEKKVIEIVSTIYGDAHFFKSENTLVSIYFQNSCVANFTKFRTANFIF